MWRERKEEGEGGGGREGIGKEGEGRPQVCFDKSSLVRRSLWRQCSVYVWSLVYAVPITEKREGRVG